MNIIELDKDPLMQFRHWHQFAHQHGEVDPDAITLATVRKDGRPSARTVLLKGTNQCGFMIYTNYDSRKAAELDVSPYAAMVIYWAKYYRQVRVEGRVKKTSTEDSEHYFASRPRESQIAAWASEQSCEIPDRNYLLERYAHYKKQFADQVVPRPANWGGYLLVPDSIEFWQGQDHRMHDRLCYQKKGQDWEIIRLAP